MRVKVLTIIKRLFSGVVWDVPVDNKTIYITFDDGPEPEVTPQVLVFLSQFAAKATFFCLGEKIEQNPLLFKAIHNAGHTIGNHGYNHLSGYTTFTQRYITNTNLGAEVSGSRLFRPPYGRLLPWQYKQLKGENAIVMWSIMSMDFSSRITPRECVNNVISNVYPGSIIVFHDNKKAAANLMVALPVILEYLVNEGYTFGTLG
jgi:peptidoglycan-N-acetylglucosamine deacetylase